MGKHVLFETGIRRLGSRESGFFYRYPDSGEKVREEKVLERIEGLKIPPAYEGVRIARGPSAKVRPRRPRLLRQTPVPLQPPIPGTEGAREVRAGAALR